MTRYVIRRLAWTVVVVWAIATLTFLAVFASPVDPARQYAGARAPIEVVERVRSELGLDRPLWVQYTRYVGRIATGDFGESFSTGKPVLNSTLERLPRTMLLASAAMAVSLALGLPLGIAAALSRRSVLDKSILGFSLAGVVTPTFVLGFMLLYFFAFRWQIFPLGGSEGFMALVLPALSLGVPGAAWYARMLRSTVLNILGEDYIRMA